MIQKKTTPPMPSSSLQNPPGCDTLPCMSWRDHRCCRVIWSGYVILHIKSFAVFILPKWWNLNILSRNTKPFKIWIMFSSSSLIPDFYLHHIFELYTISQFSQNMPDLSMTLIPSGYCFLSNKLFLFFTGEIITVPLKPNPIYFCDAFPISS